MACWIAIKWNGTVIKRRNGMKTQPCKKIYNGLQNFNQMEWNNDL